MHTGALVHDGELVYSRAHIRSRTRFPHYGQVRFQTDGRGNAAAAAGAAVAAARTTSPVAVVQQFVRLVQQSKPPASAWLTGGISGGHKEYRRAWRSANSQAGTRLHPSRQQTFQPTNRAINVR